MSIWLIWSWRDLRARWVQVLAIALIIAIGSGVYTGLSSNTRWRESNYAASYEALASHDFMVSTAEGTYASTGDLVSALSAMEHPDWVVDAEERLVVATQVDARESSGTTLLVPGRIVGVDVRDTGPGIDQIEMVTGRSLTSDDSGEPVVVLDAHFVAHHDLPPQGEIELSGGPVSYVGAGYSPEYFVVASDTTSFLAEAGFAVMYAPLETAQTLSGLEGQVSSLGIRLRDNVDVEAARIEIEESLSVAAPDLALETTWLEEERLYRRLFDDIKGDQKLFNIFSVLILSGAAFAAFNLTGRIVESQRREIGVGMALGVHPWKLAVRPLLVGFQISLVGSLLGIAIGIWMGQLVSDLNLRFVPLPVWEDDFQFAVYLRGAALGLFLPFGATVLPVFRAVRVDPIEAIQTRPGMGTALGLAPWFRKIPFPGNSISQYPFRNVVRAPRRTTFTAMGIAAAIAVLVALVGMLDSFVATIEQGEAEILGDEPDRATVTLASRPGLGNFYLDTEPEVTAVTTLESVAIAEPQLLLFGSFLDGEEEVDTLLTLMDLDSSLWTPTALAGQLGSDEPSVVISQKAAEDLSVQVGEMVTLRHLVVNLDAATGADGPANAYEFVNTEIRVSAIHPNPYRFMTYVDRGYADLFGLPGVANVVSVLPAEGVSVDELKLDLFGRDGVAAVEGVNEVAAAIQGSLEDLLGFLTVIEGFVLLMALLIAFNSTSISSDERRREHATMFAYGLSSARVLWLTTVESFVIGALGTLAGIVMGRLLLGWMISFLLPQTIPDLGIVIDVSNSTYLTAALLGVLAVTIAPLFTLRRLRAMDIPSTLRVVE